MWTWIDQPWQYRILDQLRPGVDIAQIQRALQMTPTERVESVVALMRVAEDIAKAKASNKGDR
jgi:hypothetical protein